MNETHICKRVNCWMSWSGFVAAQAHSGVNSVGRMQSILDEKALLQSLHKPNSELHNEPGKEDAPTPKTRCHATLIG